MSNYAGQQLPPKQAEEILDYIPLNQGQVIAGKGGEVPIRPAVAVRPNPDRKEWRYIHYRAEGIFEGDDGREWVALNSFIWIPPVTQDLPTEELPHHPIKQRTLGYISGPTVLDLIQMWRGIKDPNELEKVGPKKVLAVDVIGRFAGLSVVSSFVVPLDGYNRLCGVAILTALWTLYSTRRWIKMSFLAWKDKRRKRRRRADVP